jgi:acyl-CoA synthetase (AMP-forming)/AMP-acid ligase II
MLTIVVPSLPVAALRAAIKSISATDLTARERIAAFKVPREVAFRKELPKSSVLKILRRQLLEEELAGRKR